MEVQELTQSLVKQVLQLDKDEVLTPETALMGGYAEFNSLTLTNLIVAIEERLGCEIDDDELTGEIFATVGSLTEFVSAKARCAL